MTAENLPVARTRSPSGLSVPVSLKAPLDNLETALALSDVLARSELVPRSLQGKPSNVFHVIMTGDRLGLHWTESVRVIYSAGPGSIGLRGSFLLAQLLKAGHAYSMEERADWCAFSVKRGDNGMEHTATFTIDMAIQAGLAKRDGNGRLVALSREGKPLPWMAWTATMLMWRAVAKCVNFIAPEVSLGFEIEGHDAAEPQPEVELKPQAPVSFTGDELPRPQAPAPPEPSGQAAAGGQAAQVAQMDADARAEAPALADPVVAEAVAEARERKSEPLPRAEPGSAESQQQYADFMPDPAAPAAEAPAGPSAEPKPGKLRAGQERVLLERFADLGWNPEGYKTSMLEVCSLFCRRRIVSVRGMQPAELARLSGELEGIWKHAHPDARVTALADARIEWRESWQREDPEAFAQYEAGQ